jgi:hypothetical protein
MKYSLEYLQHQVSVKASIEYWIYQKSQCSSRQAYPVNAERLQNAHIRAHLSLRGHRVASRHKVTIGGLDVSRAFSKKTADILVRTHHFPTPFLLVLLFQDSSGQHRSRGVLDTI